MNRLTYLVSNVAALSGFIFCIVAQLGTSLDVPTMLRGLFLLVAAIWLRISLKDGQP